MCSLRELSEEIEAESNPLIALGALDAIYGGVQGGGGNLFEGSGGDAGGPGEACPGSDQGDNLIPSARSSQA